MAATMCMLARGTISWGWLYTASDLAKVFWRTGEFLPMIVYKTTSKRHPLFPSHEDALTRPVNLNILTSCFVKLWHPKQFHKGVRPLNI